MPLQLPTLRLPCHYPVYSQSPVRSYRNSSFVNLAFVSLLSPSNLGFHSLPLGSSLWLTLTGTDYSCSTSGWHQRNFSLHDLWEIILESDLFFLAGLGRPHTNGESPSEGPLPRTSAAVFRFAHVPSKGSLFWNMHQAPVRPPPPECVAGYLLGGVFLKTGLSLGALW